MAQFNDLISSQVQDSRAGWMATNAAEIRRRALQANPNADINIFDPVIDALWGALLPTKAPNSYFDYYFSGQDINAFIEGTEDDPDFAVLPLISIGFTVQQQKQPVYGFWSYTYDAVMRGTRLVSGQFVLATKSPDYIKTLLSKAAQFRSQNLNSAAYPRQLTDDDANIQQFWGKNIDPTISALGKQVFSVHPPFNFVMKYGVQTYSVDASTYLPQQAAFLKQYKMDEPLFTDVNERLVDSDPLANANKIILDACELTDMATGYGPDGSVITETYSFIARDLIIPSRVTSNSNTSSKSTGGTSIGGTSSGGATVSPPSQPSVPPVHDPDAQHQHWAGTALIGGFATQLPTAMGDVPPPVSGFVGDIGQQIVVNVDHGTIESASDAGPQAVWAGPGFWGFNQRNNRQDNIHRWYYNADWRTQHNDGNWYVNWSAVNMHRQLQPDIDGAAQTNEAQFLEGQLNS